MCMYHRPSPTRVCGSMPTRLNHRDDVARVARHCTGDQAHLSALNPSHRLRRPAALEAYVRALLTPRGSAHQALPADTMGDAPPPADEVDQPLPAVPVSVATQQAIAKLDVQAVHPAADHLACAIRFAGGSDEAVSAALRYRCSVCARLRAPRPAVPRPTPHGE